MLGKVNGEVLVLKFPHKFIIFKRFLKMFKYLYVLLARSIKYIKNLYNKMGSFRNRNKKKKMTESEKKEKEDKI